MGRLNYYKIYDDVWFTTILMKHSLASTRGRKGFIIKFYKINIGIDIFFYGYILHYLYVQDATYI